ncbi:hypothetical protein OGAPHI_004420 [Ogataea philodendri]|uniref:Kinetochore-associated protein MTW1 n=1 Tax=Ogataea philodendri TaxID=1378263 RepID=A0A9P8T5S5_9ASCO|nr:uncharacterized protein OGAPHI_004420 [Ogataea philodendri]KAH3666231.1 hypothetical protein OGAPHI_004420 [Ogataea philodendri]
MSNGSPEMLASQLLTEHLGFQPISVIDDIINVINEIMYRCTEQLELALIQKKFDKEEELRKQQEQRLQIRDDDDDVIVSEEELSQAKLGVEYTVDGVQKGTATLESLLEHVINKNFDKFEVYAMRNILNIPEDLVSGGYIRLKHHEGMEIRKNVMKDAKKLGTEYERLLREVEAEIRINKALNEILSKFSQLLEYSRRLKSEISFIDLKSEQYVVGDLALLLEKLVPLKETYKFLINEVSYVYDKVQAMRSVLDDSLLSSIDHSEEDKYLNGRISRIMRDLGFEDADGTSDTPQVRVELVQKLNSALDKPI